MEDELGLEVSLRKSVTIASRLSLAAGVARTSRTGKLRVVRATKMLGAPSGGGRRRSTKALADRLPAFKKKIRRIHAARRAGVKVGQIVRAAGTPAVTYGVEVVGMADTQLQNIRSAIARATTPDGGGKNPDLVLWACDTQHGTTDPAFDAHVLPLQFWAMAWWQKWRPRATLQLAVRGGQRKLSGSLNSPWQRVTGPATAVVATAGRLGWTFVSPSILRTDDGHTIDLELDPPATVTREAKAAVRRWRMARIRRNFPCLLPMSPDDCDLAGSPSGRTATLDLTNVLDKLLRSRAGTKDFPDRRVSYRPDLISAISGGQWSQARLASTRKWTDIRRLAQAD